LKVSVIIINYNTFDLTCQCIESIYRFTKKNSFEIILVDNASNECSVEKFSERFPAIKCVSSYENSGFAKGNNLGIFHSKGDIILLLNSDTYLTHDAISMAAAKFEQNRDAGVVSCRMLYPDGGIQHVARYFRSISWELLDIFRFILYFMPYKKRAELMLGKYFKCDFDTECDWVSGAFFMFPKEILAVFPDKKLDERFFMYGEDHLWCWQIKKAGYKVFFLSTPSIIHVNSGSTSINKQIAMRRIMLQNELEIIKERKGNGLYYTLFSIIYFLKEETRNLIKNLWLKATGRIFR
jgi:GT2 family glycosyltransferase